MYPDGSISSRLLPKRNAPADSKGHSGGIGREERACSTAKRGGKLSVVVSTPLLPAVEVLVGMFPTRRMYGCLKGLRRWGLLDRRRDARGLVIYKISRRGRE